MWLGVVLPHGCSPCPSTRPQRPRSHRTLDGGDDEPQHAHAPTRATTTIDDRMARVAGSLEPVPVEWLVRADGFVPKARYTSAAFADLELQRLWSRVWQVAAREEELAQPGDFVEYTIGDESILVVRAGDGTIGAFHNVVPAPRHAPRRGRGRVRRRVHPCPYHGWQYDLDGALVRVVDAEEFTDLPDELALRSVRVDMLRRLRVRQPRPRCEATARVPRSAPDVARAVSPRARCGLRSYRTTIIDANWKAVVDAFNEGYHVQGLHPQILPWTDDVSIEYEQLGTPRALRPPARARAASCGRARGSGSRPTSTTRARSSPASSRGWVARSSARSAPRSTSCARPGRPPGRRCSRRTKQRRMELLAGARRRRRRASPPDQMTSADDVFWFPNLVGPIYPGSALLFRVRPYGRDPDRSIKDTWVLEWPPDDSEWQMPPAALHRRLARAQLGEITEQDYANLAKVQRGMRSSGLRRGLAESSPRGQHPADASRHRPLSDLSARRARRRNRTQGDPWPTVNVGKRGTRRDTTST